MELAIQRQSGPEDTPLAVPGSQGMGHVQLELGFNDPTAATPLPAPSRGGEEVKRTPGPIPSHLGEVLSRLEADPSRERRHVEMKSAVRKMAEVLRRPLQEIPTDPQTLRGLVGKVTPAASGMSRTRWSRIRSLVSASLRDMGCDLQPGRDTAGHSDAWKALANTLSTRARRFGLSRFMSYCTRLGVEPDQVDAATFAGFGEALQRRSLYNKPDALHRATIRHWNRAAAEVPEWPQVRPQLDPHPKYYSFEWAAFPESLTADVEAFLAQTGSEDEFDEHYVRAVRPATVELRRRQLRQLASLLVLGGFPIEDITRLAVLADVKNATIALKHQRDRTNGQIGISNSQHAWLLRTIALHWVKDLESAGKLAIIAKRLHVKPKGMTDRNRGRLRQFDHRANVQALLQLPRKVFSEARRSKLGTEKEARRVTLALAVELLTVAPMRVGNLCSLELDRHFVVIGRGKRATRHIIIPAAEMKSGESFEVIVPPDTAEMIDFYLRVIRPVLHPEPSRFLFPSARAERRAKTSFSTAISAFVKRETGIFMHAHLFRHLAGKLHLEACPNDVETVRRILQHASSATTLRYYAESRTSQAFASYGEIISNRRADPMPAGRRLGRGR